MLLQEFYWVRSGLQTAQFTTTPSSLPAVPLCRHVRRMRFCIVFVETKKCVNTKLVCFSALVPTSQKSKWKTPHHQRILFVFSVFIVQHTASISRFVELFNDIMNCVRKNMQTPTDILKYLIK